MNIVIFNFDEEIIIFAIYQFLQVSVREMFFVIWIILQIQLTCACIPSPYSYHKPPLQEPWPTNGTIHESYDLQLNKLFKGQYPVVPNLTCNFSMDWDFSHGRGLAHLLSINDEALPTSLVLHPLGIAGRLGFMTGKPTILVIGGKNVTIEQVTFIWWPKPRWSPKPQAWIIFNNDGSVIQATENAFCGVTKCW